MDRGAAREGEAGTWKKSGEADPRGAAAPAKEYGCGGVCPGGDAAACRFGRCLDRVAAISPGGGAVRIRIEELEALRVMRKAALGGSDPEDGKVGQNDKARHPYYKGEGKDLSR